MKKTVFKTSIIIIFICFLYITKSYAQKDRFYKHYTGVFMDNDKGSQKLTQKNVILNLRKQGDQLTGTFFFADGSTFFTLDGKVKKDGLDIKQYDSKMYLKGTFKCKFEGENNIKGSWIDADAVNGNLHDVNVSFIEDYKNSVKLTALSGNKKYHIEDKEDQPSWNMDIEYLIPSEYTRVPATISPLAMSFETFFFGIYRVQNNPQLNITNKLTSSLTDYKNIIEKQFKGNLMKNGSNDIYNRKSKYLIDILYNDNNVLTIKKDSLEEAGTELISSGSSYYVYDMNTGKQITIKDIFDSPKYKEQMYDLFVKKIKTWLQIESDKELKDGGFDKDAYTENTNFWVDKAGISFYFNPYEVNSESVLVFFPFTEVTSFIKEKSPISHLFPKDLVFNKSIQGNTGVKKTETIKQNEKKKTEVEEDDEEGEIQINEKEGDVIPRPKIAPKKNK